ncbi:hypothetical protein ACT7DJ_13245 [Bacillus cereus]
MKSWRFFFSDLFRKANNKGTQKRLRTIKDLDAAARKLKDICTLLLDENIIDATIRKTIFAIYPKKDCKGISRKGASFDRNPRYYRTIQRII